MTGALRVLLLPGMDGTGWLSTAFASALERASDGELAARIVAYPCGVSRYDVLARTVELPAEPFAIVAESFSGPLAIRIAASRPPGLRGLVLAATFARSVPRPPPFLVRALAAASLPTPSFVRRRLLLDGQSRGTVGAQLDRALRACPPRVLAARIEEVLRTDERAALAATTVPLLVLVARHDWLVPARASRELASLRPDAEVVVVDAPHLVLQARPEEAAAHVTRFLRPLRGARV